MRQTHKNRSHRVLLIALTFLIQQRFSYEASILPQLEPNTYTDSKVTRKDLTANLSKTDNKSPSSENNKSSKSSSNKSVSSAKTKSDVSSKNDDSDLVKGTIDEVKDFIRQNLGVKTIKTTRGNNASSKVNSVGIVSVGQSPDKSGGSIGMFLYFIIYLFNIYIYLIRDININKIQFN